MGDRPMTMFWQANWRPCCGINLRRLSFGFLRLWPLVSLLTRSTISETNPSHARHSVAETSRCPISTLSIQDLKCGNPDNQEPLVIYYFPGPQCSSTFPLCPLTMPH